MCRRVDPARVPELHGLAALLLYGTARSRRRLAERLLRESQQAELGLLASTVRSQDAWQLRARSLEVLGMAAGSADHATAERIMAALLGPEPVNTASRMRIAEGGDVPKWVDV